MASTIALSHLDAYKNMKTYENFTSFEKKTAYGFGVRGKKFVLVQTTDSLLNRIWFSVLKFLRIIKVEQSIVDKLFNASITHVNLIDYKTWAAKQNKLVPSEIIGLKASNSALKTAHAAASADLSTTKKQLTKIKKKYKTSHTHSIQKGKSITLKDEEIRELKDQVQKLTTSHEMIAAFKQDRLQAVISHLKPKFDFANIDDFIKRKNIVVQHNVDPAVSTVATAARVAIDSSGAASTSSTNVTALPQGDDTRIEEAS